MAGCALYQNLMNWLIFFDISGAMLVICDVNEYRKCVKEFNVQLVSQLFERLHALCNLLGVVPENLKEVCGGEQLVSFCYVNSLFERLHVLCNLLEVVPENLKEFCGGEQMVSFYCVNS